ncbi:MAG: hypothetical protein AAF957_00950 [Planctomycetota bacterium]
MARARLLVLTQGRLERLDDLVVAAGADRRRVLRLDDALDLFSVDADEGCVAVLDLDATPDADAGLLRRWCEAHPGARLLWVGDDGARVEAFGSAGAPGEFRRWPLDVDDLVALAGATGASTPSGNGRTATPSGPRPSAPVRRNGTGSPGAGDLGAIEAILGSGRDGADDEPETDLAARAPRGPRNGAPSAPVSPPRVAFLRAERAPVRPQREGPESVPPPEVGSETHPAAEPGAAIGHDDDGLELEFDGPLLTEEELEAFFDPEPLPAPDEPTAAPIDDVTTGVEGDSAEDPAEDSADAAALDVAARRPGWLKDQTADLADIVMALDLRARANHAHVGLEGELARLRQFTRTIGYVAAPPAAGGQDFDVAVLVEEHLGDLAGTAPDAPRLLFRAAEGGAPIRADKMLVSMALDALLRTAVGCAGAGDVVRVEVERPDDAERGPLVRIQFPKGPLADLAPETVLEPYALKSRLPEIGANALAAAGGIAVGQGGDLVVSEASEEALAFEVTFSPS